MKRNKKQKIDGQFVALQHSLLNSLAYKSLGKSSKIGLIYFIKDRRST
jgi:hypothetical protein